MGPFSASPRPSLPAPPYCSARGKVLERLSGGSGEDVCFASTRVALPLVAFLTSTEEKARSPAPRCLSHIHTDEHIPIQNKIAVH